MLLLCLQLMNVCPCEQEFLLVLFFDIFLSPMPKTELGTYKHSKYAE